MVQCDCCPGCGAAPGNLVFGMCEFCDRNKILKIRTALLTFSNEIERLGKLRNIANQAEKYGSIKRHLK